MNRKVYTWMGIFIAYLFSSLVQAQPEQKNIVDGIMAVVGSEIILLSDIEQYSMQMKDTEEPTPEDLCEGLEELIFQKVMVHQAALDSVEVSNDQVEAEMERRLSYFIQQIGSREQLETYLGKSIETIKSDFRKQIKDQLVIQKMQGVITENVKVTPSEVKSYFQSIPSDSLPYIPSEVQYAQIVLRPTVSDEEKTRVIKLLTQIREDIISGSKFSIKARIYSEDPGSANKGGELGFLRREDLVPEFSAVAFALAPEEVSEIVETEFGFHIIQLIEKRGELANFRHILITPKISNSEMYNLMSKMDTIRDYILADPSKFNAIVERYSDDEDTRMNGGLMINYMDGGSLFAIDKLDAATFLVIDKLKVGEVSKPQIYEQRGGKKVVRMIKLISRTEPHVASLKTDYQKIMNVALQVKQQKVLDDWIQDKMGGMYIKIDEEYKNCLFKTKISKE